MERAILIVEQALKRYGAPIYVKHEIVHNKHVCDELRAQGVVFIEEPEDVPSGSILIYSAHGVSESIRERAMKQQLRIFDATCPLVTKVHAQVKRLRKKSYTIIMIGHRGHPEVEGTLGQIADGIYLVENEDDITRLPAILPADTDLNKIAYVTQTTLSVDDTQQMIRRLAQQYPNIRHPEKDDICYATQNRQNAVREMIARCDILFVVGSRQSSNSNRLCEIATKAGTPAYLVDSVDDIRAEWLRTASHIGITAGASAPESLVQSLISWFREKHQIADVHELRGVEEKVEFMMPGALRDNNASRL